MALYEITSNNLAKISQTTFDQAGLRERDDLQRLLKKQIEVILPDTLIVSEEFSEWEESKRRIDLLALDKNANIVVIELKRTEDGGYMEQQAIRYAAMVSTMTFDRVVEVYSRFLLREGKHEIDARLEILEFLDWNEPDEDSFGQDVRIVLASSNFSKELTTTIMWLNKRDLDIRCIRVIPYQDKGRILVDVQQVIPLPEAAEYQIKIREKEQKERKEKSERSSFFKFWQNLLKIAEGKSDLTARMSPFDRGYIGSGTGIKGLTYYYTTSTNNSRVEIYIDRQDTVTNKRLFDEIHSHKTEIENIFGAPLYWLRLDTKRASRIQYEITRGGYKDDEAIWEGIQIEMIDAMIKLEKALSPFIIKLS